MLVLSNNIKRVRNYLNLNQGEFADKIGVSKRALVDYEKGKIEPKAGILLRISQLGKVSMDNLFGIISPKTGGLPEHEKSIISMMSGLSDDEKRFVVESVEERIDYLERRRRKKKEIALGQPGAS